MAGAREGTRSDRAAVSLSPCHLRLPIGLLLTRGVDNGDAALILPRDTRLRSPPGPAMRCLPTMRSMRFAADFKSSPRDAVAETRQAPQLLQPGLRSLILFKTSRAVRRVDAPPYKSAFLEADRRLGRAAIWRAIKRTLPDYTDFYLLAAHRPAARRSGQYRRGARRKPRSIVDVLIRTFVDQPLGDADLPAARLSAGLR